MSASDQGAVVNYAPYEFSNTPEVFFYGDLSGIVFTPRSDSAIHGWAQPFTESNTPLGTSYNDPEVVPNAVDYKAQRSSLIAKVDEDQNPVVQRYPTYGKNRLDFIPTLGDPIEFDIRAGNLTWYMPGQKSPLSFYGSPIKTVGGTLGGQKGLRQGAVVLIGNRWHLTQYEYSTSTYPEYRHRALVPTVFYKGREVWRCHLSDAGSVTASILTVRERTWMLTIQQTIQRSISGTDLLVREIFRAGECVINNTGLTFVNPAHEGCGMPIIHVETYINDLDDIPTSRDYSSSSNFGSWAIDSTGAKGVNLRRVRTAEPLIKYTFQVIDNDEYPVSVSITKEDYGFSGVEVSEATYDEYVVENWPAWSYHTEHWGYTYDVPYYPGTAYKIQCTWTLWRNIDRYYEKTTDLVAVTGGVVEDAVIALDFRGESEVSLTVSREYDIDRSKKGHLVTTRKSINGNTQVGTQEDVTCTHTYSTKEKITAKVAGIGYDEVLFTQDLSTAYGTLQVIFIYVDLVLEVYGWYVVEDNEELGYIKYSEHWKFPWGTKDFTPQIIVRDSVPICKDTSQYSVTVAQEFCNTYESQVNGTVTGHFQAVDNPSEIHTDDSGTRDLTDRDSMVSFDTLNTTHPVVQKIDIPDKEPFYAASFRAVYDGTVGQDGVTEQYNYPSDLLSFFDLEGSNQQISPLRKV